MLSSPPPDELEDEKSPEGQEKHPSHWRAQYRPGELVGRGCGACARVGSQQGSRQKGFQGLHCSHSGKEAEQEPRVPGTARCRVVRATAGQIHTHYHHKPCAEGICLLAHRLCLRGCPLPMRRVWGSS